jgi:anti-sigma factor RsiW
MAESNPKPDELLEAYLDGLLDAAQRQAFAEALRTDPQLRRQVELQARIDGALERLFHVEAPTREQIAAALVAAVPTRASVLAASPPLPTSASSPAIAPAPKAGARRGHARWYWGAAGLAAAAAMAWVIASLTGGEPRENQPQFVARPLAAIYKSAVAAGFEPSYDCREPERFAATFSRRQGQPLRLLAMPAGMAMLGVAYTGGLSRDTTAMLCRVDGKPVMAFVDRAGADRADAAVVDPNDALHVFRQERDGLVYYEVTPFDEPRVISLFAPATEDGRDPAEDAVDAGAAA